MRLIQGDCLIEMKQIPGGSVDLVFVDPPYNIGKTEWDKIDNYMEWCAEWIGECERLLKPNGALWISHSKPLVLAQLSGLIKGRELRNWITWDKYNGAGSLQGFMDGFTLSGTVRSWQPMAEYLIYHADEGEWTSQCDKERGFIFEPLRAYLDGERTRAGLTKSECNRFFSGPNVGQYWWQERNWQLPTCENYQILRQGMNLSGGEYLKREYEDLKREYEDLRAEFEDLRYTFNNPGKMSSVWQIPPARANGHETPKPEELLRRIVLATSNEGDTVLDPMMGSGTTGVACKRLERDFIGIEINEEYFEIAKRRIDEPVQKAMRLA